MRLCICALCLLLPLPLMAASIFVAGDSTTLQSSRYLDDRSANEIHVSVRNARDTFWSVEHLRIWMDDPDNDPQTPSPGPYDAVRLNNGIWDSQPLPLTGGRITTSEEFLANVEVMLQIVQEHSPGALVIWGTSPRIDQNRLWIDPPHTGLLDIDQYNAALVGYRRAALESLPDLGVVVDDGYAYYQDHLPADFGLAPRRPESLVFWHFDGIHFDPEFRIHETERMAAFIDEAVAVAVPVDEPSGYAVALALIGCCLTSARRGASRHG